ncbi:MAG: MerR family transcriptional regulator [Deltaproteobacteria bacterium]|nr:MerR family transcriptional regulator [Deltaproteobacteria bacterium]MBW2595718.1 MerR family transcriptional regulator [Deltaproteobacteria bacterium]MBW2650097.1 MerR family transcriptional regulator [Deltaproteobacteria bacterium]
MEMKIGEIAKLSGVQPSTIRYYVRQGLLPEPNKVNKSMAYYDKSCVEKVQAIRYLQEKRYFPLSIIKNVIRRMDEEGMSLEEAEVIEAVVFGTANNLVDRKTFLERTGLTLADYQEAERVGLLMPFVKEKGRVLFNEEDIRFGRDLLKKIRELGLEFRDLEFYVRLGRKIVEHEAELRKRVVKGKSREENTRFTLEVAKRADIMHSYIMRRLFQRNIQTIIQKSLNGKKSKKKK